MIKEITSKSILKIQKNIDSWFVSRYHMNLYRGCTHNCSYCDGRYEGYYVPGDFGTSVEVKINAPEILEKELYLLKKKSKLKKEFFMLGGGVSDSYQPAENKYQITRKCIEILKKYSIPVHILTKSKLVLRDLDLLADINKDQKAIISFSFSTCNDNLGKTFEPGASLPSEKLEAITILKEKDFLCGMFLMPVIPFISDTADAIEESIICAKKAGVDFIIFGGMTLKNGRQKDYFYNNLKSFNQRLLPLYNELYKGSAYGSANHDYYKTISDIFHQLAEKHNISVRIPLKNIKSFFNINDYVFLMLEHINYKLRMSGKHSGLLYSADVISQKISGMSFIPDLKSELPGTNQYTSDLIDEIIETGTCKLYNQHYS